MVPGKDIKHTIESAVTSVANRFTAAGIEFGHGTDNAWDEACWLVLHAMNLSPVDSPDFKRVLSANDCERVEELTRARTSERMPLAYLTGSAWFAGLEFITDERALVPRSPLAEWVVDDFFGFSPVDNPALLDLCTGGGCIAIAAAVHHPNCRVTGSDLSADALALAADNIAKHQVEERVSLVSSDVFEGIEGCFDLIVSNPPYVDAEDIGAMPKEYLHEPEMALGAGDDGLVIVHRILKEAAMHLTEQGMLVVEVGNSAAALEQAYPSLPFFWLDFQSGGEGVFALTRQQLQTGFK